jgi:hypothetical protein
MRFARMSPALLAALAIAVPAAAKESGSFVVRLGQDTTSVEQYLRAGTHLDVRQVGRAPRVLARHLSVDYDHGAISRLELVVTPPGSAKPTQTIHAHVDSDSLRVTIQNGDAPAQNSAVAIPKGTLVVASSSPWAVYEGEIMKLAAGKADSLRGTMYFLGAASPDWLSLHKLGRDSVSIFNGHLDQFHAKVDKAGHILGVLPIAGTGKFSVERVPSLDVDALAASFQAREQAGAGLGVLSPRDTVRVENAGGASLWVDYGRPGKRGRAIFGSVVPYGEVWRTGANAATQFKTDKALDFGGTVVPAGFYTLWTIPSANGWKLVINGETGQWGTKHDASKDLYTVDMSVSTLPAAVERFTIAVEPSAQGGVLNLDWDTTRASAAFTVKP